ncbi:MAG: hypothetical protein HUJ62_01295, partial [Streptococcus gallolyticus]|nr:hypothetical protein [Streptococcus gallolyticus]
MKSKNFKVLVVLFAGIMTLLMASLTFLYACTPNIDTSNFEDNQDSGNNNNNNSNSQSNNQETKKQPSLDDGGIVYLASDKQCIKVNLMNPDTGEVNTISTFPRIINDAYEIGTAGGVSYSERARFNPDYTLITATKSNPKTDNSTHIGYVDKNGNFTDVTEKVTPKSDFSQPPKQSSLGFDQKGEYFYFKSESTYSYGLNGTYKVPINNVSKDSLQKVENYQGQIYPDGSVAVDGKVASDSTLTCFAPHFGLNLQEWSKDKKTYLALDNDNPPVISLYRGDTLEHLGISHSTSEECHIRDLIPKVKKRVIRSPIFSADEQTVLFISYSDEGM